ncbi:MAG: hypothetical protein AAF918_00980 [Pseudomonadota bacterium]
MPPESVDGQIPSGNPFEAEIRLLLEAPPTLRPVAVLEEMLQRQPDLIPGNRRTFGRRAGEWRAKHGRVLLMTFRQKHEPGVMGISDVTEMMDLEASVACQPMDHRLYHFRYVNLASNMGMSVLAARPTSSSQRGLLTALWSLGSVPARRHRSWLERSLRRCYRGPNLLRFIWE